MKKLFLISLILSGCGSEQISDPIPEAMALPAWYAFGDSLSDTRDGIYQYAEQLRDNLKDQYEVQLKGVGGNVVYDLLQRVDADILAVPPEVLTILIGINDVKLFCEFNVPELAPDEFRLNYMALLDRIQSVSAETKIILINPFVFYENGYAFPNPVLSYVLPCIEDNIEDYSAIVREMGILYNLQVIETQPNFDEALNDHEISDLSGDGIHLTTLGNSVLAETILSGAHSQ